MPRHHYPLTQRDRILVVVLEAAGRHLDLCARGRCWGPGCDLVHDRLGFYGLGRN